MNKVSPQEQEFILSTNEPFTVLKAPEVKAIKQSLFRGDRKRNPIIKHLSTLNVQEALQINKTAWLYKTKPYIFARTIKNKKFETYSSSDNLYWVIVRAQ